MRRNLPVAPSANAAVESDDRSLFSLLADQARDHNRTALWMTAVGGFVDMALVWQRYPGLQWVSSAFATVVAYGAWGLADRARAGLRRDTPFAGVRYLALTAVRAAAIPAGVIAALAAVAGFMAVALRGFGRFG